MLVPELTMVKDVGFIVLWRGLQFLSILSSHLVPQLDRPKEVEWFKYQLLERLLLWIMGHGSGLPHMRAALRLLGACACASWFLFWFSLFSVIILLGFSVEFDSIKRDMISCISIICMLADSRGGCYNWRGSNCYKSSLSRQLSIHETTISITISLPLCHTSAIIWKGFFFIG